MLDYLRKNASSWFSKAILGLIALIFALYFGFSGGGAPQGGTAPIAKVNGQSIPSGLFNQTVTNQLGFYQRMGQQGSQPEMQKIIQTQVLSRLIGGTLLAQEAHQLGLHISDEELAQTIRNSPNFRQDGRFNEEFYLKQFKPYYERQNGQNFEFTLREDLLRDRFRQLLTQANVVSQDAVQDALKMRDTKLKFTRLQVPFGGETRSKSEATQIALEWIQSRLDKKSGQKILKKHNLDTTEVGPKSLQALTSYFGGPTSLPILSCLLKSKPGQVCPQPFTLGKTQVAVQLLERSGNEPDETASQEMAKQLSVAKQNIIVTGVTNYLTRQAKIETFLDR